MDDEQIEHNFEYVTRCQARVCSDCGTHAGITKCNFCGWTLGDTKYGYGIVVHYYDGTVFPITFFVGSEEECNKAADEDHELPLGRIHRILQTVEPDKVVKQIQVVIGVVDPVVHGTIN